MGIPMGDNNVQRMTVSRVTPEGDVVLVDQAGLAHPMTAADVARLRTEPPPEEAAPSAETPPPPGTPPAGEAPPPEGETRPPPAGAAGVTPSFDIFPPDELPPAPPGATREPPPAEPPPAAAPAAQVAAADQAAAAERAATAAQAPAQPGELDQRIAADQADVAAAQAGAAEPAPAAAPAAAPALPDGYRIEPFEGATVTGNPVTRYRLIGPSGNMMAEGGNLTELAAHARRVAAIRAAPTPRGVEPAPEQAPPAPEPAAAPEARPAQEAPPPPVAAPEPVEAAPAPPEPAAATPEAENGGYKVVSRNNGIREFWWIQRPDGSLVGPGRSGTAVETREEAEWALPYYVEAGKLIAAKTSPPEPVAPAAAEPANTPVVTQEKHTKTGADLWFVRFPEKTTGLGPLARSLKGYWSAFRGGGMQPGWAFKSLEAANEFATRARLPGEKPTPIPEGAAPPAVETTPESSPAQPEAATPPAALAYVSTLRDPARREYATQYLRYLLGRRDEPDTDLSPMAQQGIRLRLDELAGSRAGPAGEPMPPSGERPAAPPSPFDAWADEVFKVYQEQGSEAANTLFDTIATRENLSVEQWSQISQQVRDRVEAASLPWGKGVNYVPPERPVETPAGPRPVEDAAATERRNFVDALNLTNSVERNGARYSIENQDGRFRGVVGGEGLTPAYIGEWTPNRGSAIQAARDYAFRAETPEPPRAEPIAETRAEAERAEPAPREEPAAPRAEAKPAVTPAAGTPMWAHIGKNYLDRDLYRDKNGVRSYVDDNGIRHTEPVQIIPTRGGMRYSTAEPLNKDPEWQVAQPRDAYEDEHGLPIEKEYYRKEPENLEQRIARQLENAREVTEANPTRAEIEAGNYPKGRVNFYGIPFVMENARGALREGIDEHGEPWESQLAADYGYISRTVGAEGTDNVDAFIGPDLGSQQAFVIDQFDPDDGFDEHKVMLGYKDWPAARDAYLDSFSDGRGGERLGNYTPMSLDQLKAWLDTGDTRNPIGQQALPLGREEPTRGVQNAVPPGDEGERPATVQRPAEERGNEPAPAAEERAGAPTPRGDLEARSEAILAEDEGGGGDRAGDADRVPGGQREGAEPGAAAGPADTSGAIRPPTREIDLEPGKEVGVPSQAGRVVDWEVKGTNFPLTAEAISENRSPLAKARDNLAAIELAKRLVAEKRPATRAEQALLARYVGWGGVSGAFKDRAGNFRKGFEDVGQRLAQVLTKPEYDAAAQSTLYAHYTSEPVIKAMWSAMQRMGFKGGSVFEPGMGIGHFLGFMPPDIAQTSRYHGLEIDPMTATIAKLLYPESGIRQADFKSTPYPENVFDIAIGNPPFHDVVVQSDPKYRARGFVLHDYFFAKSLDSVRPGGLLGFITSAGTMNKLDTKARKYLADRAEFVGGVRMPSSTFARSANTEVTTDILFFKKRGQILDHAENELPEWTQTVQRDLPNRAGEIMGANVNRYFSEHPEQVLGEEGMFDKLVAGERYAVRPTPGMDVPAALNEALARLPENIMTEAPSPKELAELDFSRDERKDGSFYEAPDGTLMQYRDGAGRPVARRGAGVEGGRTSAEMKLIRELVPIRDAMRAVYRADLGGGEEAIAARTEFNRVYDEFVSRRGPLNKTEYSYRRPTPAQLENLRSEAREDARDLGREFDEGDFDARPLIEKKASAAAIASARQEARNRAAAEGREFNEGTFDPADVPDITIPKKENLDAFSQDPEHHRLAAIEQYDDRTGVATKRTIFFENPLDVRPEPQVNSANDGVLWSLNQHGKLDLDQIAEKLGKSRDDVIKELGDSVYRVPGTDETYQTADEYLSGDVVSKLEEARAALESDPKVQRNVEALEKVQPAPISPADISIRLGMPWMGTKEVGDFMREGLNLGGGAEARYLPALGRWIVGLGGDYGDGRAEWSTLRMNAEDLLTHALNRTAPKVFDPGEKKGSRVLNEDATQAAQDKVQAMHEAFERYVYGNGSPEQIERLDRIAALYNDRHNREVMRQWNGDYLTTPGIAKGWSWRPHQLRAIARIIQSGNTYIAHAVGAGKTSVAIGAAMEMRRLGLVRKPMIVVPNHMLGQFAKEWYEQYPTARLMIADEQRFHTDRRRQFVADVAQQDLDGVVITNSAFKKLAVSKEYEAKLIQDEIAQLDEAMEGLGQDPTKLTSVSAGARDNMSTVKKLQSKKLKMEERLRGATATDVDQTHTFEELGVDFMFVDEAHQFRKLAFASQMSVKGISQEGSDMAWDLYAKTRYLDEQNPGRSLVMMSGTPVTNTIGELYSLSRYMQRAELEKQGIPSFDAWAQTYGREATELEQTAQGTYEPVTRFSKIVNAPELYKMVGQVMDVVTPNELSQYVIRPALDNGQRTTHLAERSMWLDNFQEELGDRVRAIRSRKGPPSKGDDILLSVINDGRLGAIDPRFIDPSYGTGNAPSNTPSKLDTMIDNVHRIWRDTANQPFYEPGTGKELFRGPATQLVFSNLGIQGRDGGFSGYQHMRRELIRRGVPASEISFVKDFDGKPSEKQRLFNDMNAGKTRILIGSTQKMGTGLNVQRRLVAVHNLDPLWFPADDEQRVGRILRQGNLNPTIQVHDYSTKGTYDSTMWGMMGRKGRFIEQFFRGDPNLREIEDLGEASVYEQAAAMSTADERVIELTQAKQDLDKILRQQSAHQTEQFGLRSAIRWNEEGVKYNEGIIEGIDKDLAKREDTRGKAFKITIGGKTYTDRGEAEKALTAQVKDLLPTLNPKSDLKKIAEIGGFDIRLGANERMGRDANGKIIKSIEPEFVTGGFEHTRYGIRNDATTPRGAIQAAEYAIGNLEDKRRSYEWNVIRSQAEIDRAKPLVGREFAKADQIQPLQNRVAELETALAAKDAERGFDWDKVRKGFETNGKAVGPDGHEYSVQAQTQYGRRASGEKQRYAVYENPEPGNDETRGRRPLFYGEMDNVMELLRDHTDPEKIAERAEKRRIAEAQYAKLTGERDAAIEQAKAAGKSEYEINRSQYTDEPWRARASRIRELEQELGIGRYANLYEGETAAALNSSRGLDQDYERFAQGRQGAHETARDFVLDQGRKNGLENMAVVDRDGKVYASTSDSPEGVVSHADLEDKLDDPNAGLVVHHNHPSNTGLSSWDIAALAYRGVSHIVAYANRTGAHSMASLTPWARQWIREYSPIYTGALRSLWRAARDTLEPQVRGAVESGYLTEEEGNRLLGDLTNRALDAAGVIDYVSPHDLAPLSEAGRRGMVEYGAQAVQQRLQSFGARQETNIADRIDRSTRPVLPAEAMGRLPRPADENAANAGGGGRDLGGEEAPRGLRAAEEPDFSTEATAAAINAAGPPENTRGWWDRLERNLDIAPRSPGEGDHFFNALNKDFTFPMTKAALDPLSNAKWIAELSRRRDAGGLAHDYYQMLDSWQGKPPETWRKLFAAMEILTLEGREVPTDGRAIIVSNEDRPLAALSKPGDVIRITDPSEIRMFADYRKAMDQVWKDLVAETAKQVGWEGEPTAKAIYEAAEAAPTGREKAHLTRAARIVAGIEMMRRDSYLPLMRSGDYFVRVTPKAGTPDKPGIPGWNAEGMAPTVTYKLIDSMTPAERAVGGIRSGTPKQAEAEIARLRETFPEAEYDITHGYAFRDTDTLRDLDIPAVDKLMMLVANDGRNQLRERMEAMGMPKKEAQAKAREDYDKLVDAVLDQVYDQRVAGFKKPRLGIPGYDSDFAKSTGSYFNWLANHIASMRYRPDIEAADEGIERHPDPRTRAFWRDWDRRQEDYGDQMNGPLMALRQGSFYWLLGANAATTAKILLHGPLRGVPVLTTGLGGQGRMQALGTYLNASRTLLKGLRVGGRGIEIDLDAVRGSLSPEERAMFDEAERTGVLHPQTANELASARTQGEEILTPQRRFFRRVLDIWGSNVSAADRLTRSAMLLSGYRVAKRAGMDAINQVWDRDLNWKNAPEKTPQAFGQFMVDKTVGIWGDINRLPAMRSQLGGMIGQFKLYEMGYLSNLHQMLTRMGPEGKVTAALMLGGLGMMGGAMAIPFAQDVAQAGEWAYGLVNGIEPDLDSSLRHAFDAMTGGGGEEFLHGARPLGIDWSGIGFGDIIGKNVQSPLDLIGAAGSTVVGAPYRAMQRERTGQGDLAAFRELTPNAVKHMLDALYPELSAYSVAGTRKLREPGEMTDEDRVKMGLGFRPESQAVSAERSREFGHNRSAYIQAMTVAENRIANLQDRGEPTADAIAAASRLITEGEQAGIFDQNEVARFRRDLHNKMVQRAAPQVGSRTQQRYQAVNP
jgi:N12 class adenine-specific DNA methylase